VRRVSATGEIALVTEHGILSTRPPEPGDHTVGQLVGEEVRGDGAAPGRADARPAAGGV
jgi:hypothetical protein